MGGDGSDEGHDLLSDIATWEDGLRLLQCRWRSQAARHQRARHNERTPDIEWFMLEGNHEEMVRRFARKYPGLRSLISLDRLNLSAIANKHAYNWIPFLEPISINGLVLQHYFQGLNPKQALSIQTVQSRNGCSSAFGHTHALDVRYSKDAHGRRRTVLNTGCIKHPSRLRRYEESGIFHIKGLLNGEFTYEFIPTEQLLRRYDEKTKGLRG